MEQQIYSGIDPIRVFHKTIEVIGTLMGKTIDKLEEVAGYGKPISGLPEGIIDVGGYLLIAEPSNDKNYSLQISKRFLLDGDSDIGSTGLKIKYMNELEKKELTEKAAKIQKVYYLFYKYRHCIGFSLKIKQNYQKLNSHNKFYDTQGSGNNCPNCDEFIKNLLNIIYRTYKQDTKELESDMGILRKHMDRQQGRNPLLSEYCGQDGEESNTIRQMICELMEETENYYHNCESQFRRKR